METVGSNQSTERWKEPEHTGKTRRKTGQREAVSTRYTDPEAEHGGVRRDGIFFGAAKMK